MIGPDVRIVDLEDLRLRRLVALLAEAGAKEAATRTAPGGGTLLVLRGPDGGVTKAVLGGHRLPPETVDLPDPAALPALRQRLGADLAVALEPGAIGEAFERAQLAIRPESPLLDQVLAAARVWRGLVGRSVHLDPPGPLTRWPVPSAAVLRRLVRLVLPPRRVWVFYALERAPDRRRVAASLIVRQGRRGQIDLVTTDAHLDEEGLDPTDWRRDAERLTGSIGRRVGRVHLSCFLEVPVLSELVASGFAFDVVDRALRSGRLVLLHRPWWLRLLLARWWRLRRRRPAGA